VTTCSLYNCVNVDEKSRSLCTWLWSNVLVLQTETKSHCLADDPVYVCCHRWYEAAISDIAVCLFCCPKALLHCREMAEDRRSRSASASLEVQESTACSYSGWTACTSSLFPRPPRHGASWAGVSLLLTLPSRRTAV